MQDHYSTLPGANRGFPHGGQICAELDGRTAEFALLAPIPGFVLRVRHNGASEWRSFTSRLVTLAAWVGLSPVVDGGTAVREPGLSGSRRLIHYG